MTADAAVPPMWTTLKLGELFLQERRGIEPAQYPEQEFELWSVPAFPSDAPEIVRGKDVGSNKQRVSSGDVLLCKINPRINRVWVVGEDRGLPQIASTEWIVLRGASVNPYFLAHQLRESGFRERLCAEVSGVGGSLTRARPQTVAELEIFVAPWAEQHRIVAKLDELLAGSRAARAALDVVPALLDQYRQAVLAAAVREPTDGSGWTMHRLADLIESDRKIAYGVLKPGEHDPSGVRLLKSGQVRDGFLELSEDFRITPELDRQFWRTKLRGGEVLLNLVGASIGRSAVALPELAGANVSRAIAVIPVLRGLADWVQLSLQGPSGRALMRSATGGSAQGVLNLSEVRELPIALPPDVELQERTVAVRCMLKRISGLSILLREVAARVDALDQSALSKAFRGRLLPQDPTDEPADVHLARVRDACATPVRAARRRPARP